MFNCVFSSLVHRGLVPQLWPNYTGPPLPPAETVPCGEARIKCAYRDGCGLALQNYAIACRWDGGPGKEKKRSLVGFWV